MKTTVLAVLLLQLILQVTGVPPSSQPEYKYGDIIAFQRERLPGNVIPYKFMHFGIYIDKLRFEEFGQKTGDNLFHITGPIYQPGTKVIQKFSDCIFGKVSEESVGGSDLKRFNYLDEIRAQVPKIRSSSEEAITERILCKLHNCQRWDPLHDNCEHLATYVRYGIPISLQLDNKREGNCRNKRHGLTEKEEQEIIKLLKAGYKGTETKMNEYFNTEAKTESGSSCP